MLPLVVIELGKGHDCGPVAQLMDEGAKSADHLEGVRMKTKLLAALVVAGGLLLVPPPMFAHHAEVVYDLSRTITLTGTVTKFMMINPHGKLHFQVEDDQGNVEDWILEMGPPSLYIRRGWNRKTIEPGDKIVITFFPHKKGLRRVRSLKLVINGKVLVDRDHI